MYFPAISAQIAQSVEQETENLRVRGSIPRLGTILNNLVKNIKLFKKDNWQSYMIVVN